MISLVPITRLRGNPVATRPEIEVRPILGILLTSIEADRQRRTAAAYISLPIKNCLHILNSDLSPVLFAFGVF